MIPVDEFVDALWRRRTQTIEALARQYPSLVTCPIPDALKNDHRFFPLHVAAFCGDPEVASTLLHCGAEADARVEGGDGRTALHLAASHGHIRIGELLLDHGARVAALDCSGRTPLQWAFARGRLEMAAVLVRRGAEVNARSSGGETLLHQEVRRGRLAGVRLLLGHGASVHPADAQGRTPLHLAAAQDRLSIVRLLLHCGAALRERDAAGRTPQDVARERRHRAVADLLARHAGSERDEIPPDLPGPRSPHSRARSCYELHAQVAG